MFDFKLFNPFKLINQFKENDKSVSALDIPTTVKDKKIYFKKSTKTEKKILGNLFLQLLQGNYEDCKDALFNFEFSLSSDEAYDLMMSYDYNIISKYVNSPSVQFQDNFLCAICNNTLLSVEEKKELILLLIKNKCSIFVTGMDYVNLLFFAKEIEIAQLFLDLGVKCRTSQKNHNNLFFAYAVILNPKLIEFWVKYGLDINYKNKKNQNALDYLLSHHEATMNIEIVTQFLEQGLVLNLDYVKSLKLNSDFEKAIIELHKKMFPEHYETNAEKEEIINQEEEKEKEVIFTKIERCNLDEQRQNKIKQIFPGQKDGGFTYLLFLMTVCLYDAIHAEVDNEEIEIKNLYIPKINEALLTENLDLKIVINLSRRRDLLPFIRQKIKIYLALLPSYVEALENNTQTIDTQNAHRVYARYSLDFIKRLQNNDNLLPDFVQRIIYDIEDLKHGFSIEEWVELPSIAIDDIVEQTNENNLRWFNPENLIKAQRESSNDIDYRYYKDYLRKLDDLKIYDKPRVKKPNNEFFTQLAQQFPNFIEVINYYQSQFLLNQFTKNDLISPILLLGEPGVGKTHFAQAFAKGLNTGYCFIDMASISDSWVLSGLNASYKSAKPGRLFSAMHHSLSASPVVLLDEVEKTVSKHGRDPTSTLYQILEPNNAKEFVDEFIDFPVDLSHMIIMATANDLNLLAEPLQSRFRIFTIPKPNQEQFENILQFVYEEQVISSGIFEPLLSQDVIKTLSSLSIREAKIKIAEGIGQSLLELNEDEITKLEQNKESLVELKTEHINAVMKRRSKIGF